MLRLRELTADGGAQGTSDIVGLLPPTSRSMAGTTLAWKRGVTGYRDKSLLFTGYLTLLLSQLSPAKVWLNRMEIPLPMIQHLAHACLSLQHSARLFRLGLCFYLLLCKAPT